MECFLAFFQRLGSLTEGAGTILDQSLIYTTSDVSSGLRHEHLEFPELMAGKAAGGLKGGRHRRAAGGNTTEGARPGGTGGGRPPQRHGAAPRRAKGAAPRPHRPRAP